MSLRRYGEYEVERELARGGMGTVYVARHRRLGRRVALKVLQRPGPWVERFQLEARAVAQLDHPSVVGIHEVGVEQGRPWFAMELVEGESLAERLKREGPLPEREAAVLVEAIARAVAHAHARGILHRDLKPANVLLTEEGRPLLTDFGLARALSEERERLTRSGEMLGTPSYMPPEQANGDLERIGPASDVYGLGALLYATLCGRPPHEASSLPSLLNQVLTQPPPRPTSLRPTIDRDLEAICLRALAKHPPDRHPSAEAFADALLGFVHGERSTPGWGRWVAGGLAVVVISAAAAASAWSPAPAPAPTASASSPAPTPTRPPPPTRTTAPEPEPSAGFARTWVAPPQAAGLGTWDGGFLPDGRVVALRRKARRVWLLRGRQLTPVSLGSRRGLGLTVAGERVIVVTGRLQVLALTGDALSEEARLGALEGWQRIGPLAAAPDGAFAVAGRHTDQSLRVRLFDRSGATEGKLADPKDMSCLLLTRDEVLLGTGVFHNQDVGAGLLRWTPRASLGARDWAGNLPLHAGRPTALAITPQGRLVLGTSGGHILCFARDRAQAPVALKGGNEFGFAHEQASAVRLIAFFEGRRWVSVGGHQNAPKGALVVWGPPFAADGGPDGPRLPRERLRHPVSGLVRQAALSPNGRRLLILTSKGFELWSVPRP